MIKRASAATLCLILVFALLPKTARADSTATGTLYFSGGKLHIGSESGAVYDGEGTTWSGSGSTLTLTNFTFTTEAATALSLPAETTLELIGTNSVTSTYSNDQTSCGVYGAGKLTVSGSGTLIAGGGDSKNFASYGVQAIGDIIMSGDGTITGTGGTAFVKSYGVYSNCFVFTTGGGTIRGVSDTCKAGGSQSYGVCSNGIYMPTTGGTITGIGGNADESCGVLVVGNTVRGTITGKSGSGRLKSIGVYILSSSIIENGGSVAGTGLGNSATEFCYGVYSSGSMTVKTGGTVKGTGGQVKDTAQYESTNYASYGVFCAQGILLDPGAYLQGKSDSQPGQGDRFNYSYGIKAYTICSTPGGAIASTAILAQGRTQACVLDDPSLLPSPKTFAWSDYDGSSVVDIYNAFQISKYKYIRVPWPVPDAEFAIAIAPQDSFPFGQASDHTTATVAPVNPGEFPFDFNASNSFGSATMDGNLIDLGSVGSPGAHGSVSNGVSSIVIHLNKAYLDTLTFGTHKLIVNLAGVYAGKSAEKEITVQPAITFTTQPIDNTTVFEGSITGSLSAAASVLPAGKGTAALNWYACDASGTIEGESLGTGGTFAIPTGLAVGSYHYLCQATFTGIRAVNSSVATVTVATATHGITVSHTNLSFGTANVGYAPPAAQTVTVTYTGNFGQVTLTQPTSTDYVIGALSRTVLNTTNKTATFTVQPKAHLLAGTYDLPIKIVTTPAQGSPVKVTPSFTVVHIQDLLIRPGTTFMQGSAPETAVTIGTGIAGFGLSNLKSVQMGQKGGTLSLLTEGTEYDAAEGSIVVTLHRSYLNTLMPGAYTLRINLTGAGYPSYVQTTIIVNAADATVPKTGDAATPVLWLGLMLLTGMGLAIRRKRQNG